MWVELSPKPFDFCGRSPCPHCYAWAEPDKPQMPGIEKLSIDLLDLTYESLNEQQLAALFKLEQKIHLYMLALNDGAPELPIDPVDIGMSSRVQLEAMLKQRRVAPTPAPKQLNCDHIADRQARRDERAAEIAKVDAEKMESIKKVTESFRKANKDLEEEAKRKTEVDREVSLDQQKDALRRMGVHSDFIEMCYRKERIYDAERILQLWRRETTGPSYERGDFSRGIKVGYSTFNPMKNTKWDV